MRASGANISAASGCEIDPAGYSVGYFLPELFLVMFGLAVLFLFITSSLMCC